MDAKFFYSLSDLPGIPNLRYALKNFGIVFQKKERLSLRCLNFV
jgi:hypothetical protein